MAAFYDDRGVIWYHPDPMMLDLFISIWLFSSVGHFRVHCYQQQVMFALINCILGVFNSNSRSSLDLDLMFGPNWKDALHSFGSCIGSCQWYCCSSWPTNEPTNWSTYWVHFKSIYLSLRLSTILHIYSGNHIILYSIPYCFQFNSYCTERSVLARRHHGLRSQSAINLLSQMNLVIN